MQKILMIISAAISIVRSTVVTPGGVDPCSVACNATSTCNSDTNHQGSYCKYWLSDPVCFGLYVTPSGASCFQPNDPTCDDRAYAPLSCMAYAATVATSTVAPAM